ncbi:competence type IV pilus minor pilin ComGE [Streptococcus pseudoporcinus]|uniref:Exported protein n=1 Tax=Streptococcus pseudoporcinus TaxID=361101 RepID=A0A4U9XIS8_9STRE|nr:competence type IV pilus minor pilin ComGE [Streptococcus pseudoporcinus]VTS12338.1 exported protein [Streptococcus pseudoporcinus]VUC64864.1 exported protein [Streptococcus pseudoporcinus]VUC95338.1 exported protein [Streptococcus pseudoporcinus]VUC95689.1 exported protein [Streptococcus pseudoporcinus]
MVPIKKRNLKAYILYESLLATAILIFIVTLFVTAISRQQREMARMRHRQEAMAVALMAVQTNQNQLQVNGCRIHVFKNQKGLRISENHQEIFRITKK